MPQLVIAWRSRRGDVPEVLKRAGGHGERHVAALISLAIAGPATVTELADRLDVSHAHASLVVGELAKADLVERNHAAQDRRLIIVSLSETAKPAVAEMRRRNAAPLLHFLRQLDEPEADRFITHLSTLIGYIRADAAEGSQIPS